MTKVEFTCMTTKKKFDVDDPEVVVLANGRYAYRADCPWPGKNGKALVAYKFCSREAYSTFNQNVSQTEHGEEESEHIEAESEHTS